MRQRLPSDLVPVSEHGAQTAVPHHCTAERDIPTDVTPWEGVCAASCFHSTNSCTWASDKEDSSGPMTIVVVVMVILLYSITLLILYTFHLYVSKHHALFLSHYLLV